MQVVPQYQYFCQQWNNNIKNYLQVSLHAKVWQESGNDHSQPVAWDICNAIQTINSVPLYTLWSSQTSIKSI